MTAVIDQPRCTTCGDPSLVPVGLCGRCAEDWNTNGGRKAINRRRRRNGMKPLHTGV